MRYLAGKFGMLEHWAGRFLGGFIIYLWYFNKDKDNYILLILWSIYFISHHIEKFLYGRGQR